MIPDEAVEAAARVHQALVAKGGYSDWDSLLDIGRESRIKRMRAALEAALPILLSHEREETRLAHLDAVVNAASVSKYEAAVIGDCNHFDIAEKYGDYHVIHASTIRAKIDEALAPWVVAP